jgi:peptide deformylase
MADEHAIAEVEQPDVEEADHEQSELEREAAQRRAAALARVRKFGDPVLRTRARALDRFDQALLDEVIEMGEIMNGALGVGLAATQLGVLHRVLVYRIHPDAELAALVNPEIEFSDADSEEAEEGCLSLPEVLVDVGRSIHVRVRSLDEHGEQITIEASGLEARVIQHEIDHLDGVLILDRTTREQRKQAMRTLRDGQAAA